MSDRADNCIAIIGMSCRFPGAPTIGRFWDNLCRGVESIRTFTAEELEQAGVPRSVSLLQNYVAAGAPLGGYDLFDPGFFGVSPREAAALDPQRRVFLECAWEALEDAGHAARAGSMLTGVYAGCSPSTYLLFHIGSRLSSWAPDGFQIGLGNDKDYLPTYTSYKLNLRGPSVAVQTACSTSLVAVHMASQALLTHECDLALAGAATVRVPHHAGYVYRDGHIHSPDGHCRAFDARAEGTVFGSGAGVVVLKRLADAMADGDRVYAVIRGSAVNNDGSAKVGYTAPSAAGQAEVIAMAQSVAGIAADLIGFVEAHGTGTALGDPIEIAALTQVFRARTQRRGFCAVGSVKTNVGHLETAAGLAGLIKAVLAVRNGLIPPTLHFERPNPMIRFDNSPFFVNRELIDWPAAGEPRRAAVSSFGIGGTNAHLLLEQFIDEVPSSPSARSSHLLVFSAKSESAAEAIAAQCGDVVLGGNEIRPQDASYTLTAGRAHFEHRRAAVLSTIDGSGILAAVRGTDIAADSRLAFLFTGQGAQYAGMGRQLYESQPVFKASLEACEEAFARHGVSVLAAMMEGTRDLDQTIYSQPALFAIGYALGQMWRSWGVEPDFVAGHSLGEYAAAVHAGLLSLEDGVRIVSARGRLVQALAPGAMIAVMEGRDAVERLIAAKPAVELAGVNGPRNIVLSGDLSAIAEIKQRCASAGIGYHRLPVSHAFHSAAMEPILDAFESVIAEAKFGDLRCAYISSVTGRIAHARELRSPSYWRRQLRSTVQFESVVRTLDVLGAGIFVEIGPHPVLIGMARQAVDDARPRLWLPSMRRGAADWDTLNRSAAELYCAHRDIDWTAFHRGSGARIVSLPTYPFERTRHWFEGDAAGSEAGSLQPRGLLERIDSPAIADGVAMFRVHPPACVAEHRVGGQAIWPAALFVDVMLAAARAVTSQPLCCLEGLSLPQRLPFEAGRQVQAILRTGEAEIAVEIVSRAAQQAEWRPCATATIPMRSANAPGAVDLSSVRALCAEEHDVDAFYSLLSRCGTEYGSEFRRMRRLASGQTQAMAELDSAGTPGEGMRLPVGLMDAVLQPLAVFSGGEDADGFVAMGIDRVWLNDAVARGGSAYAVVSLDSADTRAVLSGQASLCTLDGEVMARIEGFHARRIAAAPSATAVAEWMHQVSWVEQPMLLDEPETADSFAEALPRLEVERVQRFADGIVRRQRLDHYAALLPELNALAAQAAASALLECGVDFRAGGRLEDDERLAGRLGVTEKYRLLLRRLMTLLERHGWVRRDGESFVILRSADDALSKTTVQRLIEAYPAAQQDIELLVGCARSLAGVLRGVVDPLPLLFPQDGSVSAADFYHHSPLALLYNSAACETVLGALASITPTRPARILEVGAGTGATTALLLPRLASRCSRYVFSDISPAFLSRAANAFREFSFVEYRRFDFSADPAAAGFKNEEFDIVIAANALHAAPHLQASASHLHRLLAPGGFLVLLEGTGSQGWIDLIFGLTDGWWSFRDPDLRAGYPLIDAGAWDRVLSKAGFANPVSLSILGDGPSGDAGQCIIAAQATGSRKPTTLAGVVCGAGLNLAATASCEEIAQAAMETIAALQQARDSGERLWMLTRGAQAVAGEAVSAAQAALWGLGRTIASEYPEHWGGLIDIDPNAPGDAGESEARRLIRSAEPGEQWAIRGGRCFVCRLAPAERQPAESPLPIASDRTYLITGGLGALGLLVARHLCKLGARHVVLLSRTPLVKGSAAAEQIEALCRDGARVEARCCDVSDPEATRAVIASLCGDGASIKGVIHAAGVADDRTIEALDAELIERLMKPKLDGARVLFEALGSGLDFFVLFSSASALTPQPGQAAYAMANAALDGFAFDLCRRGVPAITVNWGAWEGVGLAASDGGKRLSAYLDRAGLARMSPAIGLAVLEQLLRRKRPQTVVFRIAGRLSSAAGASPLLKDLRAKTPAPAREADVIAPEKLRAADSSEREPLIRGYLGGLVGRALMIDGEALDTNRSLVELGFDSLMAIEVRNTIRKQIGVDVPLVKFVSGSSIEDLSGLIAAGLDSAAATEDIEELTELPGGESDLEASEIEEIEI